MADEGPVARRGARHCCRLSLILAALCLLAARAAAWNVETHEAVADAAWQLLTPDARAAAANLLAAHPDLERGLDRDRDGEESVALDRHRFRKAASWPDHVRSYRDTDRKRWRRFDRGTWHWVNERLWASEAAREALESRVWSNLETTPSSNSMARDNVLQALAFHIERLGSEADTEARAVSLAWVLHLVADLHQPMHAVALFGLPALQRDGDQGGNLICLDPDVNGTDNLHAYWDRRLSVVHADSGVAELSALLRARVDESPGRADRGSVFAWWRESVDLATGTAYPAWLRHAAAEAINGERCRDEEANRIALRPGYGGVAEAAAWDRLTRSVERIVLLLEEALRG